MQSKLLATRGDDAVATVKISGVQGFGNVDLRVVESYKDLGAFAAPSGNLVPEARHRARAAMNSYVPLAASVFGTSSIPTAKKMLLAMSLVFSRLF